MDCSLECWLVPAIIGQAVGFILGLLFERRRSRQKVAILRREISELKALRDACVDVPPRDGLPEDTLGPLPRAQAHGSAGTRAEPMVMQPSTMQPFATRNSCEVTSPGPEALFNEVLKHLWPHISKYVATVLREDVQPAMQASMPDMLRGIHFSEQKCHLGSQPMYFERIVCLKVNRGNAEEHLRLVAEVALVGNCEIELEVPLLSSLGRGPLGLSKLTETHIGVSDLRLRGTLVVELCNLRDDLPLIGGIRVYFVNPPDLDLKLTGALGWMQNVGIIKKKLVDAVLKQLGSVLVLPKRVASPFADDVDIFRLLTPMPEGMLRLQVRAAAGADTEDGRDAPVTVVAMVTNMTNRVVQGLGGKRIISTAVQKIPMYIKVVFGDSEYRTPTVHLDEKNALRWEFSNTFDFTVHDPVAQKFMVFLYMEEHHLMFGRCQGDCLAYGEVNAQEIIVCPRKIIKIHMSKLSTLELAGGEEIKDLEVTIGKEWRSFTAAGTTTSLYNGSSADEKSWSLFGRAQAEPGGAVADDNEDINCKLLVGFYGARNLPSDKLTYWCKVSCTNVTNFSGGGKEEIKAKETFRVQGQSTSKWRYPPLDEEDETISNAESVRTTEVQESYGGMVEVIWEQPKFFHFHDHRDAELTVELFCSGKKKPLGSFNFNPSDLSAPNGFTETVDLPLRFSLPGLTKIPSVRIVFQLWLLHHDGPLSESSLSCHLAADLGHQFFPAASVAKGRGPPLAPNPDPREFRPLESRDGREPHGQPKVTML